jgi:hypothetical protein
MFGLECNNFSGNLASNTEAQALRSYYLGLSRIFERFH